MAAQSPTAQLDDDVASMDLRPCPSVERFLTDKGDLYLLPPEADQQTVVHAPWGAIAATLLDELDAEQPLNDLLHCSDPARRDGLTAVVTSLYHAEILRPSDAVTQSHDTTLDRQHRYFAQCGVHVGQAQERLAAATVIVLGVGGVGGHVAEALARSGVGHLVCVDDDQVAPENLARQSLYSPTDVGRLKVTAARERLSTLAPSVQVSTRSQRVHSERCITQLVSDCGATVLACSADSPAGTIDQWLSSSAHETGVPYISGGQRMPTVSVGPFVRPGHSSCGTCFDDADSHNPLESELAQWRTTSDFVVPALGCADMLVASFMVRDIVAYISGAGPIALMNQQLAIDMHSLATTLREQSPSCALCTQALQSVA